MTTLRSLLLLCFFLIFAVSCSSPEEPSGEDIQEANEPLLLFTSFIPQEKTYALYTVDGTGEKVEEYLPLRMEIGYSFTSYGNYIWLAGTEVQALNTTGIIRIDMTTKEYKVIYQSDECSNASVSPDGSQIVFAEGSGDAKVVRVMNSDGTGVRDLFQKDLIGKPLWSPDGTAFLYTYATTLAGARIAPLHLYFLTSGEDEEVDSGQEFVRDGPSWSPDGNLITYVNNYYVNLYDVAARSHRSSNVKPKNYRYKDSKFMPDGSGIICYKAREDGLKGKTYDVIRVDLETSKWTVLWKAEENIYPYRWSPDQTEFISIPADSPTPGVVMHEIWLYNADGTNGRHLTTMNSIYNAIWLP